MSSRLFALLALTVALPLEATAQQDDLAARIEAIADRPIFKGAVFGVKVAPVEGGAPLYQRNADKLFVPGSTTKLLTVGTALALLGPEHRFHTRLYRTGPVREGTVDGDLVLVASGDPNLSQRISDDRLLFTDVDHSYGSDPTTDVLPGDPLLALRGLAEQLRQAGIRRVTGGIKVDTRLFEPGERELGTGTMLSSIMVNDNVADIVVRPGATAGAEASVTVSPATGYLRVVNRATTAKDGRNDVRIGSDSLTSDGGRVLTVTGRVVAGGHGALISYKVPEPAHFAAAGLRRALEDAGVTVGRVRGHDVPAAYSADQLVAEHVSPPFAQAAKVVLKVSQNLHASMLPWLLGATMSESKDLQGGFDLERKFLSDAGLDLTGAVQSDGAGGAALYSPDFMVSYLQHMAHHPAAAVFIAALPILGKDGTLHDISVDAPAAGHVFAKTGTYVSPDLLNRGLVVDGKGLAGYLTTKSGRRLAFAIYINRVKLSDPEQITSQVGQAAGDIAAAIYELVR